MKIYHRFQNNGYSLTHPRDWNESLLYTYYAATRYRKNDKYVKQVAKDVYYSQVPTRGDTAAVDTNWRRVKCLGVYKDKIEVLVELAVPMTYDCDMDDTLGYHLTYRGYKYYTKLMEVKL